MTRRYPVLTGFIFGLLLAIFPLCQARGAATPNISAMAPTGRANAEIDSEGASLEEPGPGSGYDIAEPGSTAGAAQGSDQPASVEQPGTSAGTAAAAPESAATPHLEGAPPENQPATPDSAYLTPVDRKTTFTTTDIQPPPARGSANGDGSISAGSSGGESKVDATKTAAAGSESATVAPAPPTPPSEAGKKAPKPKLPTGKTYDLLRPYSWPWVKKFSITNPDSWPFIPVPEIATDPNGGTTGGVLAAVLFTNEQQEITSILAPDVETNSTLGPGGTFRYLAYPSENTQWYAVAGAQQDIERHVDLDFQTGRLRKAWWSFEGRFFFEEDPTERFYGLGNDSRLGKQTNYTTQQIYGLAVLGLNFTEHLQLAYTLRPRWVRIYHGGFENLPYIGYLFPNQKGLNGGTEVLNQFVLAYDTRDSIDIPRAGGLALAYYGIADRRFMSSISYNRFGGELRRYYALNDKITLAGHLFMEYEPAGNEMPFWSMARLGGEDSLLTDQQTLRGYGAGRFIDNNLAVANIEVRTRVWDHNVFGTHGIFELAPFLDVGRVAHSLDYDPLSALHTVGGIGFRGIALPFVVGYVDVGYGGEGVAVFSGVNYPF